MKESVIWSCHFRLEKFFKDEILPYEITEQYGNLLVNSGALAVWQGFTGSLAVPFNAANAYIGIGDSTTPADITQTALLGANQVREPMLSPYPKIGISGGLSADNLIQFSASFPPGVAEWGSGWQEWGIFNAQINGIMLNRKIDAKGIKGANQTWVPTITILLQ